MKIQSDRLILVFIFSMCAFTGSAQNIKSRSFDSKTGAYFRSASVVNDKIAWVAGSKGTVGRTLDGGETWLFHTVLNFETMEFRSIYAFDSVNVIIANAGSPAYILRTTDAGRNWNVVYKNTDPSAFIDGIDFWNAMEGLVYGDAILGKMLLVQTRDAGMTWKELPEKSRPQLNDGEGSFAASGTGIRCYDNNRVVIATGGKVSRLWMSENKGASWKAVEVPIVQGEKMTGIYSVSFTDAMNGIVVGGNYDKPSQATNHVFYTTDGGITWQAPSSPTRGLRECVEYITPDIVLSSGTLGIDISMDGGKTWRPFSNEKQFSVVRKAQKGNLVLLTGAKGRVSLLQGFQ